jgi:GDP-L-fucose synthase
MNIEPKIFVAGHRGMVGSAVLRQLTSNGVKNIVTKSHLELDLTNQACVNDFFERERPDQVYLAAARIGGVYANSVFPADFIYTNLMIQTNVVQAAHNSGVQKLLFLGSSCIYPRYATQPMAEDCLMTGALEPTNESYAIAKIAGIKLCESYVRQFGRDYRSVMPTNLYGPGDNYHPEYSHVVPGLIRRFHEAKVEKTRYVNVWGTGTPLREFLHVDDMALACLHVMNLPDETYKANTLPTQSHINVGSGVEIAITDLARLIAHTVGYGREIIFDDSKPDGAPRKLMNSSLLASLGWHAKIPLQKGLADTYLSYVETLA